MNDLKTRVTAAQHLLERLSGMGFNAVICGGYARDAICGKNIRDVDLYVSIADYYQLRVILHTKPTRVEGEIDEQSAEYQHQSVARQDEFTMKTGFVESLETDLVNLIGLTDGCEVSVPAVIEKFNLGICKAGIDLNGIQINDDFRADFKDKQITLHRLDWGHEASLKQFIKLQKKFPWPLRVIEQQELF